MVRDGFANYNSGSFRLCFTLGPGDFSSALSSANTENSRRTREKPTLVPWVRFLKARLALTQD